MQFNWCTTADTDVGANFLRILSLDVSQQSSGISALAALVPSHYASEEHLAGVLRRLGKASAASLIETKLPTTKSARSGDLGEILATEWIDEHSGYRAPIKRLRWKDHRNMAMRGEDVIGIAQDQKSQGLWFLKTEAKSRATLTGKVLLEARAGLDKDGGLPSPHALTFMSARLIELGQGPLADAIDDAVLKHLIPAHSVRHLIFTFSGNAPHGLLLKAMQGYGGAFTQWKVGLSVVDHGAFVAAVYDAVIANAKKP